MEKVDFYFRNGIRIRGKYRKRIFGKPMATGFFRSKVVLPVSINTRELKGVFEPFVRKLGFVKRLRILFNLKTMKKVV
jgi:hypothetical protein